MPDTGKFEQLRIIPLKVNITKGNPQDKDLDESAALTCQFNPETLTMSKSNKWTFPKAKGSTTPDTTFGGGDSGSMTLELLFDTTESQKDVRGAYFKLVQFAMVKPSDNPDKQGEPRQVVVKWGTFMSYVAVIESVNQTFTLFHPNGTPLRAQVSISLREVWDGGELPPANPTSRSEVRQTWVVEKGQRLEWIAYRIFGRTSAWRHIAETNNLLNPAVLRPGQILKIVPMK